MAGCSISVCACVLMGSPCRAVLHIAAVIPLLAPSLSVCLHDFWRSLTDASCIGLSDGQKFLLTTPFGSLGCLLSSKYSMLAVMLNAWTCVYMYPHDQPGPPSPRPPPVMTRCSDEGVLKAKLMHAAIALARNLHVPHKRCWLCAFNPPQPPKQF